MIAGVEFLVYLAQNLSRIKVFVVFFVVCFFVWNCILHTELVCS